MADFTLRLYFLPRGGFLHSADATVGMTQWGDVSTNSPTVSRAFYVSPPLISQGCALPASPGGSFCTVVSGVGVCRKQFRPFTCGTAHRPFPTYFNDWIEVNNVGRSNNCQLSTVHCQLTPFSHTCLRNIISPVSVFHRLVHRSYPHCPQVSPQAVWKKRWIFHGFFGGL